MKRLALFLLTAVISAGCASSRVAVQPGFWQMSGRTVGVAITAHPKASAHRAGSQGLLDMAINEAATGSLESHLRTLEPEAFAAALDVFTARLEERGFVVKRVDGLLSLDSLPRVPSTSGNSRMPDFRSFADQEKVDFLVVLSIGYWGTVRNYYGFIPLESPKGMCAAKGMLVETRTNNVGWRLDMDETDATISVTGPWDSPPDFPLLTQSVQDAVRMAVVFLETDFFGPATAEKAN